MAKAAIVKKISLSASGILNITDNSVELENTDTGECIPFAELLSDFNNRVIKLSINYDEDYE